MFANLPCEYRHKTNCNNRSAVAYRYWRWCRAISLTVLIIFTSSLFLPVFALSALVNDAAATNIDNKVTQEIESHNLIPIARLLSAIDKNIDSLIEEMRISNSDNSNILRLIQDDYFTKQLSKIKELQQNEAGLRGVTTPLSGWTKKEFDQWRQAIASIDIDVSNNNLVAEIAAVLAGYP